jgi:hypothetical protein
LRPKFVGGAADTIPARGRSPPVLQPVISPRRQDDPGTWPDKPSAGVPMSKLTRRAVLRGSSAATVAAILPTVIANDTERLVRKGGAA